MIIINLGFPKTSSTSLQTYFYPNLNDINFLGYKKNNLELFKELNKFIENRKNFSKSDLNDLIKI